MLKRPTEDVGRPSRTLRTCPVAGPAAQASRTEEAGFRTEEPGFRTEETVNVTFRGLVHRRRCAARRAGRCPGAPHRLLTGPRAGSGPMGSAGGRYSGHLGRAPILRR